MKVLLLDTIEKLGRVGDIVEVARGYARNFLLPRSLVVVATDKQVKHHEERVKKLREKLETQIAQKKDIAAGFTDLKIVINKKVAKDGKLFGSVTKKEILNAVKEQKLPIEGYTIDVKSIPKKIGKYKIKLDFGFEVEAMIDLEVKAEA